MCSKMVSIIIVIYKAVMPPKKKLSREEALLWKWIKKRKVWGNKKLPCKVLGAKGKRKENAWK